MSKKLLLFFTLITGIAGAQPNLVVWTYTGLTVTPAADKATFTFDNLMVKNIDSFANFNDGLTITLAIDYPPGTLTLGDSANMGVQVINALDSITFPTVVFNVDTNKLKDGNNTVVIWPYGATTYTTCGDTASQIVYVPLNSWGIDEKQLNINIKHGPNPAHSYVVLQDPDNILEKVCVFTVDGKPLAVPYCAKTLDVAALPEGIYILTISTSKGQLKRKLVIKH